MKEKVLELTQKVMDSSQHFIITTKNIKRVIERTPEKNSKRYGIYNSMYSRDS